MFHQTSAAVSHQECADGLDCFVEATRSLSDEFGNAISGDISLISASYMIILAYTVINLSGRPLLKSRILLSLGAILVSDDVFFVVFFFFLSFFSSHYCLYIFENPEIKKKKKIVVNRGHTPLSIDATRRLMIFFTKKKNI